MRFINGVRHLRQEEDYTCVAACLHAVVVVGMDSEHVYIFDPARESGPDVIPMESFEAAWRGGRKRLVVLDRRENESAKA